MALSMDVAIEDVSISVDAYVNIDQMVINKRGNNPSISGIISYFASEAISRSGGRAFKSEKFECVYGIGGDCPFIQVYTYLKSMDKFSSATNLL